MKKNRENVFQCNLVLSRTLISRNFCERKFLQFPHCGYICKYKQFWRLSKCHFLKLNHFFFFFKKGFHVNLTSGKLLEFSNWELTKRSFSRFLVFFFSRKILIWEVFVREACTTPLIWLTVGGCSFSFHEHTSYEAFHVNLKHNRYF